MTNDFPRILSLLRKERKLSQKKAAEDLGIAQALLSHYEKGKRECGLEFLIKAADYYNVSTDYLLGRSPVSSGTVISSSDIPETPPTEKARNLSPDELTAAFAKKLVTNSVDVIYSLLGKIGSTKLTSQISNLFSLCIYRAFRLVYKANPDNNADMFKLPEEHAMTIISEGEAISVANALDDVKEGGDAPAPLITRAGLEQDYKQQASILLNTVMNCENQLKKLKY